MSCRRVFSLQSFNVNSMVDKSIDHRKNVDFFKITLTGLDVHSQWSFSVNLAGEKKKFCHHHVISIICILNHHSSQPISREKLLDLLL